SREQADSATMAPRRRTIAPASGRRIPRPPARAPFALELLAERRAAPGAIHYLALELAAGGVDVVATGASHRRDHPGLVEPLLERPDRDLVRALEARARERVERDQVDLGRVLHLHAAVELAHQCHQTAGVLGLVVDALHQG